MNVFELGVSLLAPHLCLVCNTEGLPVCNVCARNGFNLQNPFCYRCGLASSDFLPCMQCRPKSPFNKVWIASEYSGVAKDVVAILKFQRGKAAARVIADWMNVQIPPLHRGVIVSPVPTANKRVRIRGYDQASLIARHFAKKRGLIYKETLLRVTSTRQVGANRRDRFRHLEGAFKIKRPKDICGQRLLLIDDVLTTGATLEAAAKMLKESGVGHLDGAVFAYKF